MPGAIIERDDLLRVVALGFLDQKQATRSACRAVRDVRAPEVFAFDGGQSAGELMAFVEQVPAVPDEGDEFLGYDRSVLVFDDVFLNASSFCVMRKC